MDAIYNMWYISHKWQFQTGKSVTFAQSQHKCLPYMTDHDNSQPYVDIHKDILIDICIIRDLCY